MKSRLLFIMLVFVLASLQAEVVIAESENGTVDSKLPLITITSPAGGEVFSPDEIAEISFEICEDSFAGPPEEPVTLQFFFNDGHLPEYDVNFAAEDSLFNYDWAIPDQPSDNVYINVSAIDNYGNTAQAGSNVFEIANDNFLDGLVAYYPFNSNVNDESGNGNDGENQGAVLCDDRFGNIESAFSFDGESSKVSIPNIELPVTRTLSAWVKTDEDFSGGLIVFRGNVFWGSYFYKFGLNSEGFIRYSHYFGSNSVYSSNSVADGEWHFVTASWDGANVIFTCDGAIDSSHDYTFNPTGSTSNDMSYIGSSHPEYDSNYFSGVIDDVALFNRVLTEEEIYQLYNENNWSPFYANFQADKLEAYIGDEVQFSDISIGDISNWEWDFQNDGIIDSYGQNPLWTYEESGVYSVSLTVSNDSLGFIDTEFKEDYITVLPSINYGDVDDNSEVESYDVSMILMNLVDLDPIPEDPVPWEDWRFQRADVDLDGELHAVDGAYILQYVIGIRDTLPVYEPYRSSENIITISNDEQYIYLLSETELYGLDLNIESSGNLNLEQIDVLVSDCLYQQNNDKFALVSASGIDGNIIRIPYQLINSAEASLSIYVETNGFQENISYTLTEHAPEQTKLSAIYPNPFNPETTIEYELAESGNVKIEVYNIKGQKVAELVDENKDAGKYSLTWNAENCHSGIYFISFLTGSGREVQKAILLK